MNFLYIAKKAASGLVSVLLVCGMSAEAAPAPVEDDFLLMVIPSLIAASQNRVEPTPPSPPAVMTALDKIKQLGGDWVFSYPDFDDAFRFYTATAKTDPADSKYATINGAEYNSSFSVFIANNLSGAYNARDNVYAVFHKWGPPTHDSGSMFFFRAASRNTPGFDCHFFTDGEGKIDNYYAGYGGSTACESLTKARASSQAQAQAARYVDTDQTNAAKYQLIVDRRNVQAALSGARLIEDDTAMSPYQEIYDFLRQNLSQGF